MPDHNPSVPLPYSRAAVRHGVYFSRQFAVISQAGAGKSTLIPLLINAFDPPLEHVSAGAYMREWANEKMMEIHRFARYAKEHPEEGYDERCDAAVREHMRRNNTILDAHLAAFAPCAFLIFLTCPLGIRAERRAATEGKCKAQLASELEQRDWDNAARFARLYPGSNWIETDYDLVVDTGRMDPPTCRSYILEEHRAWLSRNEHALIHEPAMPAGGVLLAS